MSLDPSVVALLAVIATSVAGLLVILVIVLVIQLRRLRSTYLVAIGDSAPQDLVAAVAAQARELTQVRADLGVVHGNTETLRELQRGAVSRVGLVRYDAFPDMGGMLSFSTALLDEHGDGIVISAINGRQETRCYGKPMTGGTSEHSLSDEERACVDAAMSSARPQALAAPGDKRRRKA
jgi:hypothetical protein